MKSSKTFFFYDLETSGFSAANDRIMQFAGIRTDENFAKIGEPINLLVKLADDILPSPEAILVTKITPQKTQIDGLAEAEFAKYFTDEIALPNTIFVGYNNVRFDDEFMRNFLWRNFRDPYEWSWKENRSRWDLLDVVRLTRALRPDGINWPFFEKDGVKIPTNNLVDLARENNFENTNAHDALADVEALINVAKLLKEKQPQMFDYLLKMCNKKEVSKLVNPENPQPFIYASGRYSSEFEKTTAVLSLVSSSKPGAVLVWDLRVDPDNFNDLTEKEILEKITANYKTRTEKDFIPLPVKELSTNKCPAIAPLGTLDESAQKRLNLSLEIIEKNYNKLKKNRGLIDKIVAAFNARPEFAKKTDVENQLYDSFAPEADRAKIRVVAAADANDLADFHPNFIDERLTKLLLRYKARNFAKCLSAEEKKNYENYRAEKLNKNLPKYLETLRFLDAISRDEDPADFANDAEKTEFYKLKKRMENREIDNFILEELQLWVESIWPETA